MGPAESSLSRSHAILEDEAGGRSGNFQYNGRALERGDCRTKVESFVGVVFALIVLTCSPKFSSPPVNIQWKPRAILYPTCTPMWGNMVALTCISTFSEINMNQNLSGFRAN